MGKAIELFVIVCVAIALVKLIIIGIIGCAIFFVIRTASKIGYHNLMERGK